MILSLLFSVLVLLRGDPRHHYSLSSLANCYKKSILQKWDLQAKN